MSKYRKMLYFCYVLIGFNLVFSSLVNNSNLEITEETPKLDHINNKFSSPIASAPYTITGDSELPGYSMGGSGTYEDPYILSSDEIDAYKSPVGLLIQNTTKYVLIQDLYIHRADQSNLNLTNVRNLQIFNCNFQSALHSGLFLDNCSNVNITESTFGNNGEDWEGDSALDDGGVEIINSSQIIINSNIISSNNQTGINLNNCNYTQILDNNIEFNKPLGIQANDCQNLNIINNTIFNNSLYKWGGDIVEGEGVRLINSTNIKCNSNNITKSNIYGLNIDSGDSISIIGNNFDENNLFLEMGDYDTGDSGIFVNQAKNVSIIQNNITKGGLTGIYSISRDSIRIVQNRIENHKTDGILLIGNKNSTITENFLMNNSNAITIVSSSESLVSKNNISLHKNRALHLFDSSNLTIINNNIDSNQYGLYFTSQNGLIPSNLTISNNNLDTNSYGFYFENLNSGLIQNNTIFNSSFYGCSIISGEKIVLKSNNFVNSSSYGCQIYNGEKILINSNNFSSSEVNLYINGASNVSISNNILEKSHGFNAHILRSYDCNVTYNYINESSSYDLVLFGNSRTHVFGNYLGNNSYTNTESEYWNGTNYGNCWANYLDFYPETAAVSGIYNTPYQRILNSTEELSYGLNADNFPITFEYFVSLTYFFELQFTPSSPILDPITSPDADGNFTLSWSSVPLADGYYLYEANSSIDDVGNLTAFHDTSLLSYNIVNYPNGTYFFGVTAFNASGESLPSNSIQVMVTIEPTIPSIENPPLLPPELFPADLDEIGYDTDGNITLHWNAVPGAEFYNVYMSAQPISVIGTLNPIGNTTQTSYFIPGLTNGSYYFAIVAVNSSRTSTISNVISIDVQIEETESDPPPILPVVLAFMSVGGTAIGVTAANFTPVDKIVTSIKNKISKSTTLSDTAPNTNPTDIETLADEKGILKNDSPSQMQSDPSLKILEMPNGTPISIASIPNLSPTDLAAALKHHWAQIPKNTRNLVLKAVDNYLKFKDQAELILLNAHHALALSYLSTFMAFREGSKSESISTLQKISEDAKEAEFENLSHEAQKTADELKSQDSENDIDDKIEDTEEDEINSDELIEQDEEEK